MPSSQDIEGKWPRCMASWNCQALWYFCAKTGGTL